MVYISEQKNLCDFFLGQGTGMDIVCNLRKLQA